MAPINQLKVQKMQLVYSFVVLPGSTGKEMERTYAVYSKEENHPGLISAPVRFEKKRKGETPLRTSTANWDLAIPV